MENLIARLRKHAPEYYWRAREDCNLAADAIEKLRIELQAMRGAANSYKAENARLRQELQDEMYRHDRVQDFEVAEAQELAQVRAAAALIREENEALKSLSNTLTAENDEPDPAYFNGKRDRDAEIIEKLRTWRGRSLGQERSILGEVIEMIKNLEVR